MSKRASEQGGGGEEVRREGGRRLAVILLFNATRSFVARCEHSLSLSWSRLRSLFFFSLSLLGVDVHMCSHVPLPGAPCVLFFASGVFGDAGVGAT